MSGPFTTSPNSGGTTTGLSPLPSATVTTTIIVKSSGMKLQPWAIFQLLYLAPIFPIRYIHAFAQSIIVTYTPPSPSPAVSLVATTFMTVQAAPATSVATVYATGSPYVPPSTTVTIKSGQTVANTYGSTTVVGSDGSSNGPGTASGGPTKLEIVGIIVGIVGGIITAVTTVWMCARETRRN